MSAHLILTCRLSKFESSMTLRAWFANNDNFPKWNHQMLFFFSWWRNVLCNKMSMKSSPCPFFSYMPNSKILLCLKVCSFFGILLIWLVVQLKQLIEVKPITICWLLIKYKHAPGFWEWRLNHSTIYRRLQCTDFVSLSFKITVTGDYSQEI